MVKRETEIKTSNRKGFLSSSLNGTVSKQQCLLNCASEGGRSHAKAEREKQGIVRLTQSAQLASASSLDMHNIKRENGKDLKIY